MLNNKDLQALAPYLAKGKVVNIEVKDHGRKGREVLLEYSTGKKLVANLDQTPLQMKPVAGLTSIADYFARGKYGSSGYRGNCSGQLIRDLLLHYKPDTFADLAVGGGTSIDVAKDLGFDSHNSVFNDLNPKYGGINIANQDEMDFPMVDFIFFHPPYYVFPGSSMPVYSGKGADGKGMWGNEINPHDGSRIADPVKFKRWFDQCNANLYRLLHKGGKLAILMGDSRYKGRYYSMFKEMDIFGSLEQVIIKTQNNCVSDNIRYSGKFIPIQHEYLVVIGKDSPYLIPVTHVSHTNCDMRESKKSTWAAVVAAILENNGGKMAKTELVKAMEKHPKGEHNRHVAAKMRQVMQTYKRMFRTEGDYVCIAAPN